MNLVQLETLLEANPKRFLAILELLRRNVSVAELHKKTMIDPWFLFQLQEIIDVEKEIPTLGALETWKYETWREIKRLGISDARIGELCSKSELEIRALRKGAKCLPVYKTVDTCAAEFEAHTPYHYSSFEWEDEVRATDKQKVMILGSGPNRIGQGVEFDYATVHAVWALRELGYETIMVNSNPETVSTDYDTADRLYFEPLTFEDVMNIVEHEKPIGVIVQLGGQTPLKLAKALEAAGAPIIGTSPTAIHTAEDRLEFNQLCDKLGIRQPKGAVANNPGEALKLARELGFPLMARPSYVLGGRAMRTVYSQTELETYLREVYAAVEGNPSILLDTFLENALELDVDCLCDGTTAVIAGVMEHIEAAGIHSGDSACILPPVHLSPELLEEVHTSTKRLALEIGVLGLMNVQYAVHNNLLYILEANPRASRTVPFVSKAIGHPLAKYAARIAVGQTLEQIGFTQSVVPSHYSVKEVHLPFLKFKDVIPVLGPEMKSTGESMGIDADPFLAYYRAQLGANVKLPLTGSVLWVGTQNTALEKRLTALGYSVQYLASSNDSTAIPDILIDLTASRLSRRALEHGAALYTTLEAATWLVGALEKVGGSALAVSSVQEWLA